MTDAESSTPEPSSPAAQPGGAKAPVKGKRVASELPVLGGRLGIGIALLGGIVLVAPQWLNARIDRMLHPEAPKPAAKWEIGTEANVELTLITADAKRLHCAHDEMIGAAHCGYTANKRPWQRKAGAPMDDNDENVIQPYRTADTNALVLVSGLWAQPELAMRLHREPPNVGDVGKQLRFVAYCKVRFVGELKKAALRWDAGGKWHDDQEALVAKPVSCSLEAPNG
jgi:hypothetical protein